MDRTKLTNILSWFSSDSFNVFWKHSIISLTVFEFFVLIKISAKKLINLSFSISFWKIWKKYWTFKLFELSNALESLKSVSSKRIIYKPLSNSIPNKFESESSSGFIDFIPSSVFSCDSKKFARINDASWMFRSSILEFIFY